MFVNRYEELDFLNRTLKRNRAEMILLYGRRRVGKTRLLLHWAEQSGQPFTYWSAEKENADLQRRKLFAQLQNIPVRRTPLFDSWAELWEAIHETIGDERHVLILDELPYAIQSDPATLSALQHAWDHLFQRRSNLIIILCGSQVRVMESILYHQSPLFGRMTGQWHLQPLPFYSLAEFFPDYSTDERVALYAMVGGVPAYLDWLDGDLSLTGNIREVVLRGGSMFLAEPTFILYDEVREPQSYLTVLKAIGSGYHTLKEIQNETMLGSQKLSPYLKRLQELKLVERRLPILLPPAQRRKSKRGRYHVLDAYFRFYFRFISPYAAQLPFQSDPTLSKIRHEYRAFVGMTVFEDLAHTWLWHEARGGKLPFFPEFVGRHWSRSAQVDVAAVNWREKQVLLGECKWGEHPVSKQTARELFERKTPNITKELTKYGDNWTIHHAYFARAGYTSAAEDWLSEQGAIVIDLARLEAGLQPTAR